MDDIWLCRFKTFLFTFDFFVYRRSPARHRPFVVRPSLWNRSPPLYPRSPRRFFFVLDSFCTDRAPTSQPYRYRSTIILFLRFTARSLLFFFIPHFTVVPRRDTNVSQLHTPLETSTSEKRGRAWLIDLPPGVKFSASNFLKCSMSRPDYRANPSAQNEPATSE